MQCALLIGMEEWWPTVTGGGLGTQHDSRATTAGQF
jgi:hypothetical protein